MFNKPLSIAIAVTLLAAVPLSILSYQQYQLTTAAMPLMLLTLFVLFLISAHWSSRAVARPKAKRQARASRGPRESGSVKWFDASKGFGFITRDSGEDVFVHFRSIRGKGHRVLHDGQRVEFAVSKGEKGLQAEDVAVAG